MRTRFIYAFIGIIALAGWGCKSNTGPADEDLTGTWNATIAEYVSVANTSIKTDIITSGSTLVLILNTSTYTMTITDPGESPEIINGSWTHSIDTLTLTPSGGTSNMVFDLNLIDDNTMGLTGGGAWFDFTAGNFEDATLNLRLSRQ